MKNLLIIKLIFALINNACIAQDNGEFKKEDALAMINYKLTENFKGFSYSHDHQKNKLKLDYIPDNSTDRFVGVYLDFDANGNIIEIEPIIDKEIYKTEPYFWAIDAFNKSVISFDCLWEIVRAIFSSNGVGEDEAFKFLLNSIFVDGVKPLHKKIVLKPNDLYWDILLTFDDSIKDQISLSDFWEVFCKLP